LAGRESPCRDNTIEGNLGVEAKAPHKAADNGEANGRGQPADQPFPKAFAGVSAASGKVRSGFPKRSCANNDLKRDCDPTWSHRTRAAVPGRSVAVICESAFQQRLDLAFSFIERDRAHDLVAKDEKGRGSQNL
jgi:hypothetical protein